MKKEFKAIILGGLFIFTLFLSTITSSRYEKEIRTNSNVISNKKIEWGIQRNNNHEQPNLGKENIELINKYNGMALGSGEKKYIYLTFDLGYEAGFTEKILDALKENNVKGAFFVTEHYVNSAGDLVKRMIDEGHIVGNQLPHLLMDMHKSKKTAVLLKSNLKFHFL